MFRCTFYIHLVSSSLLLSITPLQACHERSRRYEGIPRILGSRRAFDSKQRTITATRTTQIVCVARPRPVPLLEHHRDTRGALPTDASTTVIRSRRIYDTAGTEEHAFRPSPKTDSGKARALGPHNLLILVRAKGQIERLPSAIPDDFCFQVRPTPTESFTP